MKQKIIYFALGLLVGAAGGATATYFVTKEMFAMQAAEEIEAYSEHCEERIEKIRLAHKAFHELEEMKEEQRSNDPEEEKIAHNEGVKKYHHDNGLNSKYGENNIFERAQSDKEREEIKQQIKDSKIINDIDEDEFMNEENGYEKQTIDVFLGDDKYMCGVWGYQTDNEDDVDRKWGKELPELIGESHTYDELLSYCEGKEDGIGLVWVKNDEMKIDFELVIHDEREEDK